jgi:hypothetical protein
MGGIGVAAPGVHQPGPMHQPGAYWHIGIGASGLELEALWSLHSTSRGEPFFIA